MNASTTLLVIAIACAGIGSRSAWMLGMMGGYVAAHRVLGRPDPEHPNKREVLIETVALLSSAAAVLGCGLLGVVLAIGGGA